MKKITIAILVMLYSFSTASAIELGINAGVSGNVTVFHATGKDTNTNTNGANKVQEDNATGVAGYTSFFIEKTLWNSGPLSRLAIGYSIVPDALSTETAENNRRDLSNAADTTSTGTNSGSGGENSSINKVQIDFKDLRTVYGLAKITDNWYVKAGTVEVDVQTNETLGTGSSYGNVVLDGTMMAIGFESEIPFGLFMRMESKYMEFDGASLTSNDNTVELKDLEGGSGMLSIGKSF